MLRTGALMVILLLIGCEQRTDFDACVEYYTDLANRDPVIPQTNKEHAAVIYIQQECGLNGN
ncbi:hypothetical protein F0223_23835 [Vibrio coralliilyticus]|uniref:hypothetical protein n=1 Tax=Vibrio TaxID=662 RepID=UPI001268F68C|nr:MULTISPECIES: hypothetical protein [Vibrio]NOI21232.1 hypothetical protein [Vibrio coralliilyticus]